MIHLVAVFAAPWSGPPPASELARVVARPLSGYMAALHLNHGYRFFAPEPGPSHLVRYELETSTGETIEGRFPDVDHHWPRLLYHRHFMVSEMIFNLVHHPLLMDRQMMFSSSSTPLLAEPFPEDVPEPILAELRMQRRRAETLIRGVGRHLMAEHGGVRIRLYLEEHAIAFPEDVRRGMRLDDRSLYRERLLVEMAEEDR